MINVENSKELQVELMKENERLTIIAESIMTQLERREVLSEDDRVRDMLLDLIDGLERNQEILDESLDAITYEPKMEEFIPIQMEDLLCSNSEKELANDVDMHIISLMRGLDPRIKSLL